MIGRISTRTGADRFPNTRTETFPSREVNTTSWPGCAQPGSFGPDGSDDEGRGGKSNEKLSLSSKMSSSLSFPLLLLLFPLELLLLLLLLLFPLLSPLSPPPSLLSAPV